MKLRYRRTVGTLLAGISAAALLTVGSGTAEAGTRIWGCEGGSPASLPGPRTARIHSDWGRTVELRHAPEIYSDPTIAEPDCAWGRITNARVGDLVWVDHSSNGGATWTQLSVTRVNSGTSAYTGAWTNSGTVMRACISVPEVPGRAACTGWY